MRYSGISVLLLGKHERSGNTDDRLGRRITDRVAAEMA